MKHEAVRGDGTKIDPGHGVVPIIKEIGRGRLKIVGTGFYITRYGLFMTARHVLEELLTKTKEKIGVGFVLHLAGDDKIHLRRILSGAFLNPADLAVGQAENYRAKFPDNPLMNIRPTLTGAIPPEGSDLATYAYPENDVLDFTQKDKPPMVSSDFFYGEFLKHVPQSERPFMPYSHFETTIEIKSGASGGPVFCQGKVIGVNCRGWNFEGEEHEGDNLSSIVPVSEIFHMKAPILQVPKMSWEYKQIPEEDRDRKLTLADLVRYGHIKFDPPI